MKNCIYEPVFGLFLLFNFQIDSALTFSSRLICGICNFGTMGLIGLKKPSFLRLYKDKTFFWNKRKI